MKEVEGDKQLQWGNPNKRPGFWPEDVPFQKVWQDKTYKEGAKSTHLRALVESLYLYHGYQPNTWIQEPNEVQSTFSIRSLFHFSFLSKEIFTLST